jgi:hypothetical protein
MKRFTSRALPSPWRALVAAPLAEGASIPILFVGNSYTFGRVDPVHELQRGERHDLTAAMNAANPSGSNPYEPHPWGGVPGIFKQFTVEAGSITTCRYRRATPHRCAVTSSTRTRPDGTSSATSPARSGERSCCRT